MLPILPCPVYDERRGSRTFGIEMIVQVIGHRDAKSECRKEMLG